MIHVNTNMGHCGAFLLFLVCLHSIKGMPEMVKKSQRSYNLVTECPGYIVKEVLETLPQNLQGIVGLRELDPLSWRDIEMSIPEEFGKGTATLSDIKITGLSKMQMFDSCNDSGMHEVMLQIPEIHVEGKYDLEGTTLGFIQLQRQGEFFFNFQPTFLITVQVEDGNEEFLDVLNIGLSIAVGKVKLENMEDFPKAKEHLKELIERYFNENKLFIMSYLQNLLRATVITRKLEMQRDMVRPYY